MANTHVNTQTGFSSLTGSATVATDHDIGIQQASLWAVGVGSVDDTDDGHTMVFGVDAVDHSVGASAGAVPIVERWA
jgi:hypothetical protein